MKRTVIVFGLISGLVVAGFMMLATIPNIKDLNFDNSMWMGYLSMLLAFIFVFVGIKSFRDKHNGGIVSFGKAFRIGLYISLIASSMYVVTWLVEYYCFFPDFMEKYVQHTLTKLQESGASPAKMKEQTESMAKYKEMYKSPVWVILLTYMEILPLGIVAALVSAGILKRKTPGLNVSA